MKLSHHILQAINEFEIILADRIVNQLLEVLSEKNLNQKEDELLTDLQICKIFQISTSHFYKLKKKHHKSFPYVTRNQFAFLSPH